MNKWLPRLTPFTLFPLLGIALALPGTLPAEEQAPEAALNAAAEASQIAQSTTSRAVPAATPRTPGEDDGYANIAVLTRAMQLIRQDYVDDNGISYRDLAYAALKGMFESLDPHSRFMEPQDMRGMEDETKSEFSGLGITVTVRDGTLTIVSPMEDTPSSRAGLLPGDQILRINGASTEKMDVNAAVERLRGAPGEKITLTILRPSTKKIQDFVIERSIIRVESVKGGGLLDENLTGGRKIGYVRLTQFSEPTAARLADKLNELEKQGMEALVLDLRFNPGGLLNSAVDVCSNFVPPGTMVVYTEGRVPSQRSTYRTPTRSKARPDYPVAVLINGGSASASEIVAGALKDLNRAVIVGETSFGKGSVQSVVQFPDGSGARFTTAKYYTPGKQVIHEKGVSPHLRVILSPEEERRLSLSFNQSRYLSEAEQRELRRLRDHQLIRAVDALKGALIFDQGKVAAAPAPTPQKSTPQRRR